jgi:hypothetical protein
MKEMDPELAKSLADLEEAQGKTQWPTDLELDGYKLICTCCACPEQYDVFKGDSKVGYLRLRHGAFRADAPVCGAKTVYESNTKGDGIFDDDERIPEITKALAAITQYWKELT